MNTTPYIASAWPSPTQSTFTFRLRHGPDYGATERLVSRDDLPDDLRPLGRLIVNTYNPDSGQFWAAHLGWH